MLLCSPGGLNYQSGRIGKSVQLRHSRATVTGEYIVSSNIAGQWEGQTRNVCSQKSGDLPPTSSNTASTTPMPTPVALDAYGTPIVYPTTAPQRIVSLVPTTSEMLASLSLDSKVVAVDYYTNYPADLTALPRVSDVNGKYNVEQIVSLKPELVLSYGADTKQYDLQLTNLGLHVVDLPSANLTQILQEIEVVGRLTFTQDTAAKVVQKLQKQINVVRATVARTPMPKGYD